ncbi:sodium:solute symporter [Ktedonosporobacter rubrisoli]|uniref:Sodium:solute symporter n=1 Tax=Ktedonosporobacter rubrisoli TaxID=2509675 RepID=A0A4P6JSX1_KTERU|nr:sodium:solute symporter [Ktedonosporobacter rubrisoli]QBD77976.1 sodium:solute symporter [Ktedonosporobacter rubrisoli]
MNLQALIIFITVFALVNLLGFFAAHWRSGDLSRLQEWGLAGRRFGTIVSWFLLGGDVYTAYSFIAVPALIFSSGALGFFPVVYLSLVFPLMFLFLPRFWTIARHRGYLTAADFVRERFDSSGLALLVTITGILATLPYIALQMYGIEIVLAQMGVPLETSLFLAFGILAAYTYLSGLRAPALIAFVKDSCIWLVVLITVIYAGLKLGGFANIFAAVHQKALHNPTAFHDLLPQSDYSTYVSLALGSAFALFLYPHTLTGILSTNSRKVIKRNAALLPAYSLLIGLIGLLGYAAIAANIKPSPTYGANSTLPSLISSLFPSWFAGFAFATIAIGALVPAAIMSIATANLFTHNIYRAYLHPNCSEEHEANIAKIASLVAKIGALIFILFFPSKLAINFQLLSNIWIIQTLPAVFLGLYTRWFHRWALIVGLLAGLGIGTWQVVIQNFQSAVYVLSIGNFAIPLYAAISGLLVNLLLCILLTPLLERSGLSAGKDATQPGDFEARPIKPSIPPGLPKTRVRTKSSASR